MRAVFFLLLFVSCSANNAAVDAASDADLSSLIQASGAVTQLNETCEVADANCTAYAVQCTESSDSKRVELRVHSPTTSRGLVIVSSGAGGNDWWSTDGMPSQTSIDKWVAAGITVVERRWFPGGWFQDDQGVVAAACESALLFDFIIETYGGNAPACLTGNSGGAAEVAYVAGHYTTATRLTLVIPTSGPPHDLIAGCRPTPTQIAACEAQANESLVCPSGAACALPDIAQRLIDNTFGDKDDKPCQAPVTGDDTRLAGQGPLQPDSLLPMVRVLIGDLDCSGVAWHASEYVKAAQTRGDDVTFEVLPDVKHGLPDWANGAARLDGLIQQHCKM